MTEPLERINFLAASAVRTTRRDLPARTIDPALVAALMPLVATYGETAIYDAIGAIAAED